MVFYDLFSNYFEYISIYLEEMTLSPNLIIGGILLISYVLFIPKTELTYRTKDFRF